MARVEMREVAKSAPTLSMLNFLAAEPPSERQSRLIGLAYGGGWQCPHHHRLEKRSPVEARRRRAIKTRSTSIARLQRADQVGKQPTPGCGGAANHSRGLCLFKRLCRSVWRLCRPQS
jgi:hypothetical protein